MGDSRVVLSHQANRFELTEKDKEMTRKDYQLIADVLASFSKGIDNNDSKQWAEYTALVQMFSGQLAKDNPRFDASRFFTACEVN
jgi:hypothetical protein